MKFAHISDLHLGKRLHNVSLLEDQKYILKQITEIIQKESVDAVLIAGDVYDKAMPSTEAVTLFDDFLVRMAEGEKEVFVISGNHDSPERIAFGSRLIAQSGVYLSPVYHGKIEPVVRRDMFGEVGIYLLPFIKPVHVRHFFPEEKIETYTDALQCAISHIKVDTGRRNVMLAHQFAAGASAGGSEELTVGGLDVVDSAVFAPFDYVALGHIHRAQNVTRETIRYSGTPLKYSFSEALQEKSMTIVEMREKGNVVINRIPLHPLRDVVVYKGKYKELLNPENIEKTHTEDYVKTVLTDEEEVPNAFANLRIVYPNLLQMEYDNKRTRAQKGEWDLKPEEELRPEELFANFYEQVNKQPLTIEQEKYLVEKIEKIWNGGNE
jgi:exonuclease SbcD